jgi:hypothetical protein
MSDGDPSSGESSLTATGRLDSWKEIAAYLKRGVTTVQRWERTEGLPVHRLPHSKRDRCTHIRHSWTRGGGSRGSRY